MIMLALFSVRLVTFPRSHSIICVGYACTYPLHTHVHTRRVCTHILAVYPPCTAYAHIRTHAHTRRVRTHILAAYAQAHPLRTHAHTRRVCTHIPDVYTCTSRICMRTHIPTMQARTYRHVHTLTHCIYSRIPAMYTLIFQMQVIQAMAAQSTRENYCTCCK